MVPRGRTSISPGGRNQTSANAHFTAEQLLILDAYAAFQQTLHNQRRTPSSPFGSNLGWVRVNHAADLHAGCTFRTRVSYNPADKQRLNPIASQPIFSVTPTETCVHDYASRYSMGEAIIVNLRLHNGDITVRNVPSDMLADIKLEIGAELLRGSLCRADGTAMPYVMINGQRIGPLDPSVSALLNPANMPAANPHPVRGYARDFIASLAARLGLRRRSTNPGP